MKLSEKTLFAHLKDTAETEPSKPLLWNDHISFTASETLLAVMELARSFHQAGVRRGDMTALRMPRTIPAILHFLALQALGAVTLMTDPHETIRDFLNGTGQLLPVRFCLSDEAAAGEWILSQAEAPFEKEIVTAPQPPKTASCQQKDPGFPLSSDSHAPAVVLFTSGTTGFRKPVVLSQYNLVNDLTCTAERGWYLPQDIALGILPLFHIFGLVLLTGVLVLHYGLVLPDAVTIPSIMECIQKHRVTRMNGVPTLYLGMAEAADSYDVASLRTGFIGAGPCTREQLIRIEEKLGMTLLPAYGMSECVAITCTDYRWDQNTRLSGVGAFYDEAVWRIVKEDGTEAAPGETGEICVKSPTLMLGYLIQKEEASSSSPLPASHTDALSRQPESRPNYGFSLDPGTDEDGLLHTGDLGYIDGKGIVHLTGRIKDIIIRNGNNLSARKIEEAILSFPGVRQAVVVALPDEKAGEVPAALVVLEKPDLPGLVALEKPGLPDLVDYLKKTLSKPEIPVRIRTAHDIPHTSSGKPDKQAVRKLLEDIISEAYE